MDFDHRVGKVSVVKRTTRSLHFAATRWTRIAALREKRIQAALWRESPIRGCLPIKSKHAAFIHRGRQAGDKKKKITTAERLVYYSCVYISICVLMDVIARWAFYETRARVLRKDWSKRATGGLHQRIIGVADVDDRENSCGSCENSWFYDIK